MKNSNLSSVEAFHNRFIKLTFLCLLNFENELFRNVSAINLNEYQITISKLHKLSTVY